MYNIQHFQLSLVKYLSASNILAVNDKETVMISLPSFKKNRSRVQSFVKLGQIYILLIND